MRHLQKTLIIFFVAAIGAGTLVGASQDVPKPATTQDLSGVHDFDFLEPAMDNRVGIQFSQTGSTDAR